MARLFSHHDRLHVHAFLGLAALLNFAGRFGYLFLYGQDSFAPNLISFATLSVHFLLHATSFQFALPRTRNWTKPMIWREFRVHNALFAYRNLIGAVLGIWFPMWWWRGNQHLSAMLVKVGLVLGTAFAADVATKKIGDKEKRTTNAMPYEEGTDASLELTAKRFYAKSQFAATSLAVFATPVLAFGSVLAIEIASFLMTLVRKGIIESRHYHIIYAWSLGIMFPAMVVSLHFMDEDSAMGTFNAMTCTAVAVSLRMNMYWSKYLTWLLALLAGGFVSPVLAHVVDMRLIAWLGVFWSAVDTLLCFSKSSKNAKSSNKGALHQVNGGQEKQQKGTKRPVEETAHSDRKDILADAKKRKAALSPILRDVKDKHEEMKTKVVYLNGLQIEAVGA